MHMYIIHLLIVDDLCLCTYQCVMDRVVGGGLEVVEIAESVSLEDLRCSTGAAFQVK